MEIYCVSLVIQSDVGKCGPEKLRIQTLLYHCDILHPSSIQLFLSRNNFPDPFEFERDRESTVQEFIEVEAWLLLHILDELETLRKKCLYSEFFWSVFFRIRTEY